MRSLVKDPRNFCAGSMFTLVGAAALLLGREHDLGSAGRMGPAYFPSIIGLLLVVVGAAGIIRSALRPGPALERFALRRLALVAGSVVAFGLLLRGAGLAPAVAVLVMSSGCASAGFQAGRFALLALALALFAALVFVAGLGLPLQVFGPWFGG